MDLKYLFVVIGLVFAVVHSVLGSPIDVAIEEDDCVCTRIYSPICALNGITYSNQCMFDCEKRKHIELEMDFEGDCDNEY